MSELSTSDQLCLFQYLSGKNEADLPEGNVSPHPNLPEDLSFSEMESGSPPSLLKSSVEEEVKKDPLSNSQNPAESNNSSSPAPICTHNLTDTQYEDAETLVFSPHPPHEEEILNSVEETEDTIKTKRFKHLAQSYLDESVSDEQQRILQLEQALDQALQYLDELNVRIKHQSILEEQITLTEEYSYVQYQAIARLQEDLAQHKTIIDQRNQSITDLASDRALTQTNLLSLQQDQLSLRQENAQWKNACQELQQECDRQHRKMLALEQENTAMQEQILQQARQSNEHETAVQYWKDRYAALQQGLLDIQALLEERLNKITHSTESGDLLSNILVRLQAIGKEGKKHNDNATFSTPSLHSFSLPDFLIRRYRHQSTDSSKSKSK